MATTNQATASSQTTDRPNTQSTTDNTQQQANTSVTCCLPLLHTCNVTHLHLAVQDLLKASMAHKDRCQGASHNSSTPRT
jgi:hypothetical protein